MRHAPLVSRSLRTRTVGLFCLPMLGLLTLSPRFTWAAPPAEVATFFEQHCYDCHGPDKQKGDLRLDTLSPPGPKSDAELRDTWSFVLDAIETGDMPPPKRPQPAPAEQEAVLGHLESLLAAASGPPPPALRRLNRVEYEYTVRDLLGLGEEVELAEFLPEDGMVEGFDKVADGLSISAVLMERYLEAADTAFDAVIRRIEPLPASTRRAVLMEGKENKDSVAKKKGGTISVDGAFVKFTPGWSPARVDQAHPIEDGVYRCRIAVFPHEPGERTLSVAVYAGPLFGTGKRHLRGFFDVTGTAENPRVIEFTTHLQEGHTLHLVPWVYPEHITWRDKDEARPGVAIAWVETHGPLDQAFPSDAQKQLFGDGDTISLAEDMALWMRHRKNVNRHVVASSQPREDAARIIREFVPRAFRRPVEDALVDSFVTLTLNRLDEGRTFEQAVRAGVTAVLCSPHFLLINQQPKVDDYTLASRLSYFLWSSMPDQELLDLAAAGQLSNPTVRQRQVQRMLEDPKRERFIEEFTGQWLDLREIDFTTPDQKLYPEFDDLLQASMLGETRGFFRHLLDQDLPVSQVIDSDFAILNQRLAEHYGIAGVRGHERFRPVNLPEDSIRGGVLTQASVLKVTANGTTTSPILRGVWILDKLLAQPAPPPPPGVPAVEPDIRGATSIREQLAKHSET